MVLDNAEYTLDPQGTDVPEIYTVVEELSQFSSICICITSRIPTIPPGCETLEIQTLSMEAAWDTFFRTYKHGEQSDLVDNILEQLDFYSLSITLLATVAEHNIWGTDRLTREWERQQTRVLKTEHSKSLAAIAFFPQGVDENNLNWLFPTITTRTNIFDKFCILSLTYGTNGFVTMFAPLRDYLSPKDSKPFPLLCVAKEHHFTRMSVSLIPDEPGFGETRWITSEDVDVEHLLDIFALIDTNSGSVWKACAKFMEHFYWHRPRLIILRSKIEGLPDEHHLKPEFLLELPRLFHLVGNRMERKRLLTHTLKLQRAWGNGRRVART